MHLLVWPAGLACMELRGFPGHGTSVAKTRKDLGKLEQVGQLVWGVKYTVLGLPCSPAVKNLPSNRGLVGPLAGN